MIEQKPASAPPCWGRQYDEADSECMKQCEYRVTCKPAFFRSNANPSMTSLPIFPSQPQPFWAGQAPGQMPFQGFPQPQPQPVTRLGTTQTPPPPPSMFAQVAQALTAPPNPMAAFMPQPVAQHPQYVQQPQPQQQHIVQQSVHSPYFMQYYSPYPGETVLQRLGKHMMLRLGQVLFSELSNFLGLWKWPPLK